MLTAAIAHHKAEGAAPPVIPQKRARIAGDDTAGSEHDEFRTGGTK